MDQNHLPVPIESGNDFVLDTSPKSFFTLLPAFVQDRIRRLPKALLEQTEEEAHATCWGENSPTPTAFRIRVSLWDEYDRAMRYDEPVINLMNVTKNIAPFSIFRDRMLTNPELLAWIIHPPGGYILKLAEVNEASYRSMLKASQLPVTDAKGNPNTKLIEVQFKIWQHTDLRLKGAIPQQINQRNLNVNLNQNVTPDMPNAPKPQSLEEIEHRLKVLTEKSARLMSPSQIDVDLMKVNEPVIIDSDAKTPGISD